MTSKRLLQKLELTADIEGLVFQVDAMPSEQKSLLFFVTGGTQYS